MEVRRNQIQNGTKLLSVVDRLSHLNEDRGLLIPQGTASRKKDNNSSYSDCYVRQKGRAENNTNNNCQLKEKVQSMKSTVNQEKSERHGEVVNQQASRKGLQTSVSANVRLTIKPDIPKQTKPQGFMCFCHPAPKKPKITDKQLRRIYGPGYHSGTEATKNSEVNVSCTDRAFSQREKLRTSVIQYAKCMPTNNKVKNIGQIKDKKILCNVKQVGNKQTDERPTIKAQKDKGVQNNDPQNGMMRQFLNKQMENGRKQCEDNIRDGAQRRAKEPQSQLPPMKKLSLCGICLQTFPSSLSLERHRKESGHYLCSQCGEALKDEAAFKEHIEKNFCKKVVCTFCNQKFVDREELENHKAKEHHKCLECNKLYKSADDLAAHNERHHGAPYTCLQCSEEFPTHDLCKKHALTKHATVKYFCPECGRGFRRMTILKRHVAFTHSDERNFQCKICAKTFKRPDALKIHMIGHSDKKPFQCEWCGRQFNQKICLTKHSPNCKKRGRKKEAVPATMAENVFESSQEPVASLTDIDKLSDGVTTELLNVTRPRVNADESKNEGRIQKVRGGNEIETSENDNNRRERNHDDMNEDSSRVSDTINSTNFDKDIFKNTSCRNNMTENVGILEKINGSNLVEIFQNVSADSLGDVMKNGGFNPECDEIFMGCRCPPTCRCKKFSIGLKVQMEESKGPILDPTQEVATLPCCCGIGFDDADQ